MKTVKFFSLEKQNRLIGDEIKKAVCDVIDSCQYSQGKKVAEFEEKWAQRNNAKGAVLVSSGTAALNIAVKFIKQSRPINHIITTPNSFLSTTACIVLNSLIPVYIDTDQSANLDIGNISTCCLNNVYLPVSLYGNCFNYNKLRSLNKDAFIIADESQNHLGIKDICSIVDICCQSLYVTKQLGAITSESGVLLSNNESFLEFARMYRNHGQKSKYYADIVGDNLRCSEATAAGLLVKLRYVDEWISKRIEIGNRYIRNLKGCNNLELLKIDNNCTFYVFPIFTKNINRETLQKQLLNNGIETQIHYPISLHLQKCFNYLNHKRGDFPCAERQFDCELSLPLYPELEGESVDIVCDHILRLLR